MNPQEIAMRSPIVLAGARTARSLAIAALLAGAFALSADAREVPHQTPEALRDTCIELGGHFYPPRPTVPTGATWATAPSSPAAASGRRR
jgi:hypothetical protein